MSKVTCKNCELENPDTSKYCGGCGYTLPKVEKEQVDQKTVVNTPKESKSKKVVQALVTVAAFLIAYFGVQKLFFNTSNIDGELMSVASEINESLPIMLDKETRLDATVTLPENVFQYNYTLVNMEKSTTDIEYLKSSIEPNVINNAKTNPDMAMLREYKVTFSYYYKDRNGVFLFKVLIGPEDYE